MAGLVDETPVISYDLYPTILSLLGLPLRPEQHVDGMDFSPILINGDHVERDDALYWHFPNYIGTGHPNPSAPLSVIRDGDWKLIESLEDSTVELFNLSQDIREEHNMAEFFPDKVAELRNKLELWRVKTNVQMPIPNPDYDAERD
jgi:arylsulfatase A-like enzyme